MRHSRLVQRLLAAARCCVLSLLPLLVAAGCLTITAEHDEADLISLFQTADRAVTFSDADEQRGSATKVELLSEEEPGISYAVDPGGYGGLALDLNGRNLSTFKTLYLELRGGGDVNLQLVTPKGARQQLALAPYLVSQGRDDWLEFAVPLAAFEDLDGVNNVARLGLVVTGQGELRVRRLFLTDRAPPRRFRTLQKASPDQPVAKTPNALAEVVEDAETATIPAELPETSDERSALLARLQKATGKTPRAMPQGHAIWLYGMSAGLARQIREYNSEAKIPIRYLFVYAGAIDQSVYLSSATADFYSAQLASCDIYLLLEGSSRYIPEGREAHQRLAADIAARVRGNPRIAGVQLKLTPLDKNALSLVAEIRRATRKRVSLAMRRWSDGALEVCDLPVLMGFNYSASPDNFAVAVRQHYVAFATAAEKHGLPYLIGVPFVATELEHEYSTPRSGSDRRNSGHRMQDFTGPALAVVERLKQDRQFVGLSVWAGLNSAGGSGAADRDYYPYELTDEAWRTMREFVY